MKAKQAVVCPKCGASSRPNGEFCARSLFTIATRPSELPSPAPATAGGAADHEAGRRQMNSGDLAGAVARLAAAVAAEPQPLEARQAFAGANQSIQDLRRGRAPSSSGGY